MSQKKLADKVPQPQPTGSTASGKKGATHENPIYIDFTISHTRDPEDKFKKQLTSTIAKECRYHGIPEGKVSQRVAKQINVLCDMLLDDLTIPNVGKFISAFEDGAVKVSKKTPQYIANGLNKLNENGNIKWDEKVDEVRARNHSNCCWKLKWSDRKNAIIDSVYGKLTKESLRPSLFDLMPDVYAKIENDNQTVSWQRFRYSDQSVAGDVDFPEWIPNGELKNYLHTGDCIKYEDLTTGENIVYCLVVEENNACPGKHLTPPWPLQIYVGKASKGVENRWLTQDGSHCQRSLNTYHWIHISQNAKSYKERLKSIGLTLVDAYLMFAFVMKFKTALFVFQKFDKEIDMDAVETYMIRELESTKMFNGVNSYEKKDHNLRPRKNKGKQSLPGEGSAHC